MFKPKTRGFFYGLFEPPSSTVSSAAAEDTDFADFAGAPDPSPASYSFTPDQTSRGSTPVPTAVINGVPYTRWYRVWERTSPKDFYQEAYILPFIILVVTLHFWGRRKNRRLAQHWAEAHAPILDKEFAVVGYGGRKLPTIEDVQTEGLAKASTSDRLAITSEFLREKTGQEFHTYATGRQNVAFMDVTLKLFKRYNPLTLILETVMSFFLESVPAPIESMEAIIYTFDGQEKDMIHVPNTKEKEAFESRVKGLNSSYDGYVWAVVNKNHMRQLREDRYDISFTSTKDHQKLPAWATVMSESAEITDTLLTPDLIKAIEEAGDAAFSNLIVTDQPIDKPLKLKETVPRKRLHLSLLLPSSGSPAAYGPTKPLFGYFLRLPDLLVSSGRFRPEVMRKIKATREEEVKKLKKVDDDEKAEERRLEDVKKKKELRDGRLKGMSAEDQRKFLEKERERDNKRTSKKMQKKG